MAGCVSSGPRIPVAQSLYLHRSIFTGLHHARRRAERVARTPHRHSARRLLLLLLSYVRCGHARHYNNDEYTVYLQQYNILCIFLCVTLSAGRERSDLKLSDAINCSTDCLLDPYYERRVRKLCVNKLEKK